MTGQDWFLIFITFITGCATGAYLYVTGFKPSYQVENLNTVEERAQNFSVIGERYGGSRVASAPRPSFRVLADGSYTFFVGDNERNGTLPRALKKEVLGAVSETDLQLFSQKVMKDTCANYVDRIDYTYRISFEKQHYILDTCDTNFDFEDNLEVVLQKVWGFIEDGEYEQEGPSRSGIGGYFESKLDESFGQVGN